MPMDDLLGHTCTLRVARFGPPGAFLVRPGDGDAVLLPRAEVPEGAALGDDLEVFVMLDSDDRPLATTRTPRLSVGEVTFLTVTDVNRFGAFVDWGLPKELLVPYAEQTRELRVGERHAIGLYVDDTGRLAGTMRVSEMLGQGGADFVQGEWVWGEAWRREPTIGVFVIVERAVVGLLPASEPHSLNRGDRARFRVANVLRDDRIELSLRGEAHEELDSDADKVLAALRGHRPPRVGDRSPPEAIRALFGLSKKAFKRAAGRLLKQGSVTVDGDGCLVAVER